jgi:hypothetical protein
MNGSMIVLGYGLATEPNLHNPVFAFGLIGLFVGPALMAMVMTMWRDLTELS